MPRRPIFPFLSALILLGSCVAGGGGGAPISGFDLHDPLGLMDVVGDLRLLIFSADGRGCSADGTIEPAISDEPDAVFPDAIVDIAFSPDIGATVDLDAGQYVVLVRGRGTDPVTMIPNQIVATGCSPDVEIGAGETREITLELQDVVGMGVCDDGVLSPDEQCEMATGPLPCAACQTQSFVFPTTIDGTQANAGAGWVQGGRFVVSFDTDSEVRTMVRDDTGAIITSPSSLSIDQPVDRDSPISGAQITSDVGVSIRRFGVAIGDFSTAMTEGGDILVRFFDTDRSAQGAFTLAAPRAGAQTDPHVALISSSDSDIDGTALVVFNDASSASGASAAAFAADSTTTSAPTTIGTTGASDPDVAATGTGFVVAFAASGIAAQRFGVDGAVVDATPIMVSASGDNPTVAALSSGQFFVAWHAGGSIRGRAFASDGTPLSDEQTVGSGTDPASGAGADRFLVAWQDGSNVHARLYNAMGAEARNRESPPSPGEFTVGAGSQPQVAIGGTSERVAGAIVFESGGNVNARLYPLP